MPDILIKRVDRGFDATIRDVSELPRGSAADGSQNVLYTRGTIKTPYGFAQVESGSLPLDSGNPVLMQGVFSELGKTQHWLAVTSDKIYDRNYVTSTWDDVTQSGQALGANIYNPVSMASVLHTDGLALNGSGDDWYHHVLVCTGITPIQRWAGKFETDFADLVGADDYHTTGSTYTTHYALQVGAFYNRPLLISPKESDASDNLIDNNQRIRWPQAGKLETWKGTGAGYRDLLDTGGYNVWGALLGTQWIQYQNNSIWSLTHVGGTRVFEPDIEMPDLGLLAARLLYSKNNVHYFIGNDYNVYAYYGGSNIENIGKKIHRFLQRDLDPTYAKRCWLCMGAENSRLWLFIVPNGKEYVTEAYAIDIRTGAWMKRDFVHKWASGGITSVSLVGASSYTEGETYAEAVATGETYADRVTSGETYGQMLETVLTDERLVLGDSAGYVYQYDSDLIQDDGVDIPAIHITEVYDLGLLSKNKIWPGIRVTAKGSVLTVSYRTSNFETTDIGWTDIAIQTLTSEFVDYEFTVHDTAKRIQFRFSNASPNLAINGSFESDFNWDWGTGWSWETTNKTAKLDYGVSFGGWLWQNIGAIVGRTYRVTFTITSYTSGECIPWVGQQVGTTRTTAGTYTEDIVCKTGVGQDRLWFHCTTPGSFEIDNVSATDLTDIGDLDFQISNYALIEPALLGEV